MSHEFKVRQDNIELTPEEEADIAQDIQHSVMRHISRLDHSRRLQPVILPLHPGCKVGGGQTQGIWIGGLDEERFETLASDFPSLSE